MNRFIEKNGVLKSTIIFTLVSSLLSLITATIIWFIFINFGIDFNLKYTASLSAIVPLIASLLIIVPFIRLIIKIDKLEKEMRLLATYDALTGLLTRRAFMEQSEAIVLQLERHVRPVCVIAIDFDDFKAINDRYGHACGDKVLEVFGEVARASTRRGDILGRLGGEEFVFLLVGLDIEGALQYLERLKHSIVSRNITYEGEPIALTISSGVYELKPGTPIDLALRQADIALYEAKNSGKDMTVVYNNNEA